MTAAEFDLPGKSATALAEFSDRLVRISERYRAPTFDRVEFPERLDESRPVMPRRLSSLAGHPAYSELSPAVQWRLGLLEAVNFFSLNIQGEQALVAELAERLYRRSSIGESAPVSRYLQHFIDEENSHTYMLAEFCNRYYGRVMPEIVFAFEKPTLSRSGTDLLFFSRVYVLETLLDFVNRIAMQDESLQSVVRSIHRAHHEDEARHIAFDRHVIGMLARELADREPRTELEAIASLVGDYAEYAFSRLVNPRVYREIGIGNALQLAGDVRGSERWVTLRRQWWEQPAKLFAKMGMPISATVR